MEKQFIRGEIIELLKIIEQQSELICGYKEQIPQIEMDIVLANIRELYQKYKALDELNITQTENINVIPEVKIDTPSEEIKTVNQVEASSPAVTEVKEELIIEKVLTSVNEIPVQPEENKSIKTEEIKPKTQKVYSPDLFSGHTSISEKHKEDKKSLNDMLSETKTEKSLASKLQKNPVKNLKSAIGINEKFKFINKLFEGSLQKYNEEITVLDSFENLDKALAYINSLKVTHKWEENCEAANDLLDLITRRY